MAHADALGISGPRIRVQVKRRADKIAVQDVRSFMAILGEGDVGLFVSIRGFTKDAEGTARNQEKRRVTLLDLRALFELWVEHYDQIPETYRRLLALKPVHFLVLDE